MQLDQTTIAAIAAELKQACEKHGCQISIHGTTPAVYAMKWPSDHYRYYGAGHGNTIAEAVAACLDDLTRKSVMEIEQARARLETLQAAAGTVAASITTTVTNS